MISFEVMIYLFIQIINLLSIFLSLELLHFPQHLEVVQDRFSIFDQDAGILLFFCDVGVFVGIKESTTFKQRINDSLQDIN